MCTQKVLSHLYALSIRKFCSKIILKILKKKFLPTLPDSIPGHMYDEHFSPDNKVIVWLPWTPHSQQCTTYYTELKICIQSVPKCETSHCHTLIVTAQELFLQASCSLYLSKALLKLNCFITKIIFIVIFMSLTMW